MILRLARLLGQRTRVLFPLVKPRHVHRRGRVRRDAKNDLLVARREDARFGMSEKKASDDFARAGGDGHRQVTDHREMAGRHAVMRRVFSEARILADVIGADDAFAVEGGCEDLGRARHRKSVEGFAWHAREGVEHVGIAFFIDQIVEKGAELSAGDLSAGIGDDLHDLGKIEFGGERRGHFVQLLGDGVFLAQRLLGHLLLMDVRARSIPANDPAFLVAQRHTARDKPAVFPVMAAEAALGFEKGSRFNGLSPLGEGAIVILRVHHVAPRPLSVRHAGVIGPPLIHIFPHAGHISRPEKLRHHFAKQTKPLFTLFKRHLFLPVFADIMKHHDRANDGALGIADRRRAILDRHLASMTRHKLGMVGQTHHHPFRKRPLDRVCRGEPGGFVSKL